MEINKYKEFNIKNKIPIMRDKTLSHLIELAKTINHCKILEIGTAFGYSSFVLSQLENIKKIATLENNIERFDIAKNNLGHINKINFINESAFDFTTSDKYDIIILDGPKSHQEKLIDKFKSNLETKGFFFIDNLFLKDVFNEKKLTKNKLSLKNKLEKFNSYLNKLDKNDWDIKKFDVDDGYAILYKL